MIFGPELPYRMSSSEEALACIRRMTKIVDDWRDNLCLDLNKMHQRNQTMLWNFKLKIQPQSVPVFDFSILTKPTSRKISISSDMAPDLSAGLDFDGVISQDLRGTSNHDPHISRLRNQTRFFTHLSCDLEPDITKPTSRKIFLSSDLSPNLSARIDSGRLIAQGFRGPWAVNFGYVWRDV